MVAEMVLQVVTGAGFLSGVVALLHHVNARGGHRAEVAKQAAEAYRQFTEAQPWPGNAAPRTPAEPKIAHQCDTPMCPCRGEVYHWCQGCDRTPNRRLMGWTDGGLYRCRSCRADGPTPNAVLDLIASVDLIRDDQVMTSARFDNPDNSR